MRLNQQIVNPSGHATDVFSNWAIDYFKQQKQQKKPFFLYLAYNAPHSPVQAPANYVEKVRQKDPNEQQNVAGNNPKIVKQMEEIMQREHRPSRVFPLPVDK